MQLLVVVVEVNRMKTEASQTQLPMVMVEECSPGNTAALHLVVAPLSCTTQLLVVVVEVSMRKRVV